MRTPAAGSPEGLRLELPAEGEHVMPPASTGARQPRYGRGVLARFASTLTSFAWVRSEAHGQAEACPFWTGRRAGAMLAVVAVSASFAFAAGKAGAEWLRAFLARRSNRKVAGAARLLYHSGVVVAELRGLRDRMDELFSPLAMFNPEDWDENRRSTWVEQLQTFARSGPAFGVMDQHASALSGAIRADGGRRGTAGQAGRGGSQRHAPR
jgi:hypothetical protein